jgi:hypothetical protein
MPDEVVAFGRCEELECSGDQHAHLIEGARPRRPQESLQLREGQFNRIEVGTVGRQEPKVRADCLDRGADRGVFVGGEVVEHDDIAGLERRHQDLFDVGQERGGVDRPVKDRRRPEPGEPQGGDDGVRLPMTAGCVIAEARARGAAAVPTQQVGCDATFVEEHVLTDVSQRLPAAPLPPRRRDIRPALFVGVYRFF